MAQATTPRGTLDECVCANRRARRCDDLSRAQPRCHVRRGHAKPRGRATRHVPLRTRTQTARTRTLRRNQRAARRTGQAKAAHAATRAQVRDMRNRKRKTQKRVACCRSQTAARVRRHDMRLRRMPPQQIASGRGPARAGLRTESGLGRANARSFARRCSLLRSLQRAQVKTDRSRQHEAQERHTPRARTILSAERHADSAAHRRRHGVPRQDIEVLPSQQHSADVHMPVRVVRELARREHGRLPEALRPPHTPGIGPPGRLLVPGHAHRSCHPQPDGLTGQLAHNAPASSLRRHTTCTRTHRVRLGGVYAHRAQIGSQVRPEAPGIRRHLRRLLRRESSVHDL